uniref:F-actin binding domain-containing protein n=1 Tax=Panagrolaimus sp. ES5 TaxID=591445 RepID=A0AC34GK16_9BILA
QEQLQPRPFSTLQRQIQRQKGDATLNSEVSNPRKFAPTLSNVPSRPSPISSSPGSGEDEESAAAMIRAQSLKDLTTKFEKLGGRANPPANNATHRTVSEKRFSCFDPPASEQQQQQQQLQETHHSTPSNFEDGSSPTVSKDQLAKLYRQLESNINDLRTQRKPVLLRNSSISSATMAQQHQQQQPDGLNDKSIIKLSDNMQRFHDICKIYAENISPHSKFRYR